MTSACQQAPAPPPADIVFVGDNIVTMDAASGDDVRGVAVTGSTISFLGSKEQALERAGAGTRIVELGERALLPGFIDSHGHVAASARFINYVNLSSPPVGSVESIDDLVETLAGSLDSQEQTSTEWLIGFGYDDSLLAERRHPTRDDLDRVSTERPVYVLHVSGHLGAINSVALHLLGIDRDTPDPPGGVIRRREDGEPDGVLEETAAAQVLYARMANIKPVEFERMVREAVRQYASFGITSVQDGGATPIDIAAFRKAAERAPFAVDIAAYQYVSPADNPTIDAFVHDEQYRGGYRLAGIKFSLDGSPQGRTAWLSEPYSERPPGAPDDYVAYPTVDPDDYAAAAEQTLRRGIPMLVHANGDAAIDLMLAGVEHALEDGIARDHRSVAIHSQLMREDQVNRAASLGVVPSFFATHTFFWGDWHLLSFGESRGSNISPTRWAADSGLAFTIHNDAPVVPPDMLFLVWAAVNRETRSGRIIGPGQRLAVMEALHAVTLGGAYQLFEETVKGSIAAGKQADLVLLDKSPLRVAPGDIKNIAIVETFARGKSVYKKDD